MKNKIVTIILGIALLLSVGGNIYLVKTMTDTKGKVNALSDQLVTANNQIADLQEQLTDLSALQAQVNDLQGQLTQSNTQIENLETTIAENNTTISDLEEQLAEQEQLLSQSQAQTQLPINQSTTNTGTTPNSTPDANGTGSQVFIPDDDPSRGGSPDNHDPGERTGNGTGQMTNTEDGFSNMPQKPEGQGNEWNSGYDENNPDPIPGMG